MEWDARLDEFLERLYLANARTNLTRVPREEARVRHVLDSLLISDLIPDGASVLDAGCGPGFPAWPLALTRPDLHVTAADSWAKAFEVMREMPLENLELWVGRIEEMNRIEEFDVATGRAFAPLSVQLESSAAWVKVGGAVIPFRTSAEREECELLNVGQLGLRLEALEERELEGVVRLFPVYRKIRPTSPGHPRSWAKMKSRPLAGSRG